jgi:hypothetical protein
MTKREAAIVAAYTGCLLGDFSTMIQYISEIGGREFYTHELVNLPEDVKTKLKENFVNLKVT